MRGKRELLAKSLERSGLLGWCERRARRLPARELVVINYHRLGSRPAIDDFDDGVLDATEAQFRAHLEVMRERRNVVGMGDVLDYLDGGALPPAATLITFDDGYRSCIDVALPLLREFGLRATFFIPTDFIEQRRVFWWDRASYLLKRSRLERAKLSYPRGIELDLTDFDSAARTVLLVAERTRGVDLERFLSELATALDVPWDRDLERRLADRLILNWDEVHALREAGMDVQSHTRSHRVLQTLPTEDLESELRGSREVLEERLGSSVRTIAYPSGDPIDADPQLMRAVREGGYDLGFTYVGGRNLLGELDPLNVGRTPVDPEQSLALFRMQLALPRFAFNEGAPPPVQ